MNKNILIYILMAVLCSFIVSAAIPTNGVVMYTEVLYNETNTTTNDGDDWQDYSSLIDWSGFESNMTAKNGVKLTSQNNGLKYYDFVGGTSYIGVADSITASEWTMSFWYSKKVCGKTIYDRDGDQNQIYCTGDAITYYSTTGAGTTIKTFVDTDFHHVVIGYSGTELWGIVDNVVEVNTTRGSLAFNAADVVTFGAYYNGLYSSQTEDDVLNLIIYNRSLNSVEVTNIYNEGLNATNPFTLPPKRVHSNLSLYSTVDNNFSVSLNATDIPNMATCGIFTNSPNMTCGNETPVNNKTVSNCSLQIPAINENILFTPFCSNATDTYNGTSQEILVKNMIILTIRAKYTNNTYIMDFNITDSIGTYVSSGGNATILKANNTGDDYSYIAATTMNINNTPITINLTADYIYNFTVYNVNRLNITFINEKNESIVLPDKINLELISDILAQNYSTINGTLFLELLTPTLYTMRYSSENYSERFYYYNLTDKTLNNLTLYMLNTTHSDEITMTTYDSSGFNELEGVYIKYLKYFTSDNTYKTVGMAKSNYEGISKAQLEKNTEFYKFFLYYPDLQTLKTSTSPSYVFQDNINFRLSTAELAGQQFENIMGITNTLEFNNVTSNFKYEFSNDAGSDVTATLKVYKVVAGTKTMLNSAVTTSSAGTVLVPIVVLNDTQYIATAETVFADGTEPYIINQISYMKHNTNKFGNMGLLVVIILTLVMLMVGYFSLSIMIALVPLPLLMATVLNVVQFDIRLAMAIQLVFLIISLVVKV